MEKWFVVAGILAAVMGAGLELSRWAAQVNQAAPQETDHQVIGSPAAGGDAQ